MGISEQSDHDRGPPQGAADEAPTTAKAHGLRRALLAWFERERRDLPWRRTRDPYAIWLSEVMLQQTRVETVVPYYERFLARFPNVHALAEAAQDDVLALWSGLGYYRRARMLHAGAKQIVQEHGGQLPRTARELVSIRGIGRYTAGAIASIAHREATPLVDGNVARVLARLFAIEDDVTSTKGVARLWALADELVAPEDPGAWNEALMELGAIICVPRAPRCLVCPVRASCEARARGIEAELPRGKAKGAVPEERRWAAVLVARGAVLLGKRKAELRFGGTWEPPTVEEVSSEKRAARALARLLGRGRLSLSARGEFVHVLTHRRLTVAVLAGRSPTRIRPAPTGPYEAFEWVAPDRLDRIGLSTLARKVLALAEVAPAGKAGHRDGG
jgi:A/G-specific adenine glycosylase